MAVALAYVVFSNMIGHDDGEGTTQRVKSYVHGLSSIVNKKYRSLNMVVYDLM